MRNFFFLLALILFSCTAAAQLLSWSPQFPTDNSTLVITVDCSKGNRGLFNASDPNNIYVHTGVTTNLSNNGGQQWLYVNGTVGGAWGSATPGLKAVSLGNNRYQFTISNIRSFYGVPAGETIQKVSILFRDVNANAGAVKKQANSDGSDMYIPVYSSGFNGIRFTRPFLEPRFVPFVEPITASIGTVVNAKAVASTNNGNLNLTFNGITVAGPLNGTDSIVGNGTVSAPGNQEFVATLSAGGAIFTDTLRFFVAPVTQKKPLPSGVKEGINYYNCTDSVTLVLYAPKKNSCMLMGDFPGSNWTFQSPYLMYMTPDSTYFWITLKGLTPGTEYAYNYVVDNTIYIADPYAEKILDPFNDNFIPTTNYPALKPYPSNSNVSAGKNGYMSVLQICGPSYNWRVNNFSRPDSKNLIIYELLVRDFSSGRNFQTVIDSINYFKRLGINAIEFMPVQEFSGNESWGYNPTFYFAPDKAYGTKNKLKEMIDTLHRNGIAVILDVVYNQLDAFMAPQGKLYWDAVNNRPAANSPWFNPVPRHPFNVFQDFNHESPATQYLVNNSLEHWIKEYKIDGFRFDLSKGFTQRQTSDVGAWGAYDQGRVDNLNRYYDYIKPRYPETYMILEHFGIPQEENVLITKGFMTWRKMTDEYNECTMGQTGNKNIGDIMWNYTANGRQAPSPSLVGFMESHDEERLMYKNLQFGINTGTYNVKDTATALRQMEAAGSIFYTVPGPKMLWQFGEMGYDVSIFGCTDGLVPPPTADDPNSQRCKLSNKPIRWQYLQQPARRKLYDAWSKMIRLRLDNPAVFNNTSSNFEPNSNNGYIKLLQIGDPNIANMQVTVVANFAPGTQTRNVVFQKTGDWYNYSSSTGNGTGSSVAGLNGLTGSVFNLSNTSQSITLAPGEYHIYVSGTPCSTPAPVVTPAVTYCQNAPAAALTATGTNLLWYTTATGGAGNSSAPTPSTTTLGSTLYYVSQTIGCEGPRATITVNVIASTPAPGVSSPVNYCQNAPASALTATGTNLVWYTTATGGTGSATAPTPSTATPGSITYYVSQTTSCGEGPRAAITVNVTALPAAPVVNSPINYCQNAPTSALTATGTNLLWYTTATGGTGTATAPTPSTAAQGTVLYYVSQSSGSCEGPRASITVNVTAVPPAPVVLSPQTYCQNAPAAQLSAAGSNLLWYTAAVGGTGSTTAPTPSTAVVGGTTFYVSQTLVCESPRAAITVNVVASTPAPGVSSPVNYCRNATASALTATGTNLLWYTTATGGTGSATAPIPSTATPGSITYYVSQTLSCGEGPRAAITVNVFAIPDAPQVSATPVTYCQNVVATPLTASGTNLLWYTTSAGGTGSATAPIPTTASTGTTDYYVSQTVNGCESPRAQIRVTVNPLPAAPLVVSAVTYCQSEPATPLAATGSNLLWYTTATGGTGSATAPTPVTTTAGTVDFYVSQTISECEGPRAKITVTVNPLPAAPTATSPINLCQQIPAQALSATGTNLLWYTTATGGTGSSSAPVPSTQGSGSNTFYVSQSNSCGESARAPVVVNVAPTPALPTGLNVSDITTTSVRLNWQTLPGLFYTVEYRTDNGSSWTPVLSGSNLNRADLSGLVPGATYVWRVNANCAPVRGEVYSESQFTTSNRNSNITAFKDGIGIKMTPNPVGDQAVVDFAVPGTGSVSMLLFNALGQRVRNIVTGVSAPGQYQLQLRDELKALSRGIYMLRIEQNGRRNSVRFLKK
jgi:glycosidase